MTALWSALRQHAMLSSALPNALPWCGAFACMDLGHDVRDLLTVRRTVKSSRVVSGTQMCGTHFMTASESLVVLDCSPLSTTKGGDSNPLYCISLCTVSCIALHKEQQNQHRRSQPNI